MKKIHFLGIGGSGASAIAKIAEAQGYEVTGCDLYPNNEFTIVFQKDQIFEGHSPNHLKNVDILAVTPAIYSLDPNNIELQEAKEKNIEILTWQEFMGKYLQKEKQVIAVCGTHGKSTTTAMIGLLLEDVGLDPTVQLGAIIPQWGHNYRIGNSKYFVTEADEFNDNFLSTHPNITVVTTVEMDHPEYFKDFEAYKKSFTNFLNQTKDKIIANLQDKGVVDILSSDSSLKDKTIDYSKEIIDFELKIPGEHNKLNASAAFQVGLNLGIKPEIIQKSLENFTGIGRRFEYLGNFQGSEVYSDFGHHPTELKVTLEAAISKFPDKKITVIFQPHMFSRTLALFNDFVNVLKNLAVDKIFIMDIYKSRELDKGLVNSKQLVEAINKENVFYTGSEKDILNKIESMNKDNQIIFFIGAGDIHDLAKKLVTN
ncbi:MAG: cyanophycin synthetase [Candidatus Daviesbacteria bacterium]|nr:cyanophycin synthetase [Candidatus Daviesbacteria bacterium]